MIPIEPLTNKTQTKQYIKDLEGMPCPCDRCPRKNECKTGKSCPRFNHFVERGTISLRHSTIPEQKLYRRIFGGK